MELSARNFDDTSASKDPNTYLAAQVQAPTPDASNRIDRERVYAPPAATRTIRRESGGLILTGGPTAFTP